MAEKKSGKNRAEKAVKKPRASLRKPSPKKETTPTRIKKGQAKPLSRKTATNPKTKQSVKKPLTKTGAKPVGKKPEKLRGTKPVPVRKVIHKPIQRKKPPTERERNELLRRSLLRKREEILQEAREEISKYIKGETRQLVDTALDDGDWSVVDLSEDISLRRLGVHRENLQKIDEALRKFNEGTYGICEDCGDEISEQRLKILPFAIYCIDCQERRERFQEMERREGLL
ncbi:MAG: TraR/DksA C4-type zinc finger protein [Nitrospirota bacterium]